MNGKLVHTLQKDEVLSLVRDCNAFDKTSIDINFNREKGNILDYLYYVDDQLVGYLVIYPSYKAQEVIITGFVHPQHRNMGIFTYLLEEAKKNLKQNHKNKIVFTIDHISCTGKQFLESINAMYTISSYQMTFNLEYELNYNPNIEIIKPTMNDIEELVKIGMEAFETTDEEERPLAINNLNDANRQLLAAKINNTLVGIVVIIKSEDKAIIGDLAVLVDHRKKGIGTALLVHAIKFLLDEEIVDIRLGVYVNNTEALNLYQKCGFIILKAEDFYELTI